MTIQSRDAVARAERLLNLREHCHAILQAAWAPAWLPRALDLLFAQPVLSVRQTEAAMEVNYTTAQRYVQQLVEVDLLQGVTGQARNRVYRAEAVLRAIDEPLSG